MKQNKVITLAVSKELKDKMVIMAKDKGVSLSTLIKMTFTELTKER